MSAALRLFVALELCRDAVRAAARARRDGPAAERRGVAPVRDEALHLTLAFLGWHERGADGPAGSCGAGADAGTGRGSALGDALLLPPRRPRVLRGSWTTSTASWGRCTAPWPSGSPSAGVYEPEDRPFRPHVTVARLRRGARARRGDAAAAPAPLEFRAAAVTLYRSLPQPRGGALRGARAVPLARRVRPAASVATPL